MRSKTKFLSKIIGLDYVTFTLGNGQAITWRLGELSAEMIQRVAIFGLSQMGSDSVAGLSKSRLFGNAYGTLTEVINELRDGRWPSDRPTELTELTDLVQDLIFALNELKKLHAAEAKLAAKRADVVSSCSNALQNLAETSDALRGLVDRPSCSSMNNL